MEREQITRRVAPLVFTPQHPGGTGTGNLPKGTEKQPTSLQHPVLDSAFQHSNDSRVPVSFHVTDAFTLNGPRAKSRI